MAGERPGARRGPVRGFVLDIVHEAGDWSAFEGLEPAIEEAAAALAALPGVLKSAGGACVVLSGDDEVRMLNASWRKKDKPTNVLSFPAPLPPKGVKQDGPRFLGDIVLAAETLLREAADEGVPPRHHLQHLVIHGLLHLIGYDHETDEQAESMEALEIEALSAIGVANPYDDRELATGH